MNILFIDSQAGMELAREYETAFRLAGNREVEAHFSHGIPEAIELAHEFRPESIVFMGSPLDEECEDLVEALHSIPLRALVLYLEEDRIYVHMCNFLGMRNRRPAGSGTTPAPLLNDVATVLALSGGTFPATGAMS